VGAAQKGVNLIQPVTTCQGSVNVYTLQYMVDHVINALIILTVCTACGILYKVYVHNLLSHPVYDCLQCLDLTQTALTVTNHINYYCL